MSFLDSLKKQAEDIKQKEINDETTTVATVGADVRQQNAAILNDILSFIFDYYKVLVDNLNVIKPDNEMLFHLMGKNSAVNVDIDKVRKTNFQVQEGESVNGNRVVLKYDLFSPTGLSVKIKQRPLL